MFLELGIVVHPYDPSTQKDQMFKASLGFEKREKNKNMEEKIRDVEGTGFYFVFVPPPHFFPFLHVRASHSFWMWFVYYGVLWFHPFPCQCQDVTLLYDRGSHVQDFPRACSRD